MGWDACESEADKTLWVWVCVVDSRIPAMLILLPTVWPWPFDPQIFVAALAGGQRRLVLEAELALASGLYWNAIFWQSQIKR